MASARVMSADIEIWKAGACQASVIRRATVRRSEVSGTTSASNGGAGTAAAGAGAAAARSTSSATMRPSGPVPWSEESSTPRSRAIRRASGEALIRPPPRPSDLATVCCKVWAAGAARFASGFAGSSGAGAGASSGTDSPSWPIRAIVRPTSTSPSSTAMRSRTPDASASTSWVTLSVSSS